MDSTRQVFGMFEQNIAHRPLDGDRYRRRAVSQVCPGAFGNAGVDEPGIEQRRQHRIDLLVRLDFVGVNPAKNQQMILFRQVVQRANDRIEPLVAPEKAEHADQFAVVWRLIEDRKPVAGRGAAHFAGVGEAEKRQRMVIDVAHAVDVFHVDVIAAGVDDHRYGLEALGTAKPLRDPDR